MNRCGTVKTFLKEPDEAIAVRANFSIYDGERQPLPRRRQLLQDGLGEHCIALHVEREMETICRLHDV